jgi:hypothetical protein
MPTKHVASYRFAPQIAGLSGGQRQLLLFELMFQRTASHSNLLLALDEPFAGITDDFRSMDCWSLHNILLVTNDLVETLEELADNTIIVSAIDRSKVQINRLNDVDREKCILAVSVGDAFVYNGTSADLKFFFYVEVANNGALLGVAAFTIFALGLFLFLATFWDSSSTQGVLIIVAAGIKSSLQPA